MRVSVGMTLPTLRIFDIYSIAPRVNVYITYHVYITCVLHLREMLDISLYKLTLSPYCCRAYWRKGVYWVIHCNNLHFLEVKYVTRFPLETSYVTLIVCHYHGGKWTNHMHIPLGGKTNWVPSAGGVIYIYTSHRSYIMINHMCL